MLTQVCLVVERGRPAHGYTEPTCAAPGRGRDAHAPMLLLTLASLFLFLTTTIHAEETPQTHWAYTALQVSEIPAALDDSWCRNPIDNFVLQKLNEQGLTHNPEADKGTLIRRLTYDLHGLPPTAKEIEAFLLDTSEHAYGKLVDRLLASPRYGERWGRHWLDIVHYGETHGFDKDQRRENAWPYRDYVINSFNEDKPYAQFVKEQIAGDVFDAAMPENIIATGFLSAGPWDLVGQAEVRENTLEKARVRNLDRDDMLGNVFNTFQSTTIQCARCHDHKFDPVSQKEYYSLQAVFAGVDRAELEIDLPRKKKIYAVKSIAPREIFILARGNENAPGERVYPAPWLIFPELSTEFATLDIKNEGTARIALAEWIVSDQNPLTWRSIVNRIWQYHFGRGIVETPNDFGKMGAAPTHPELLDWLATEFRDTLGMFKPLHKLILMSATYRQSSANNETNANLDASNLYLWRMNRYKQDADAFRDSILQISGCLDFKMGGPSVDLFQYTYDHSPKYDYTDFNKAEVWRRSVYRSIVRSVPDPFMEALDCADPNISMPVRNTTLTATQSLATLNDAFILNQAKHYAGKIQKKSTNLKEQLRTAYLESFGRAPSAKELHITYNYAREHGLENAIRVLWNCNEFMFIN